jgi:hypothetical protein
MSSLTSTLTLQLKDDVSKPARSVAMALRDVEANIKLVAKEMAGAGASDKFVASLAKLKLSKADIESVANAWRDYAKSAALAADSSQWTAKQVAGVRAWERANLSALRTVKAEQQAYARSLRALPQQPGAVARAGGAIGGLLPFAGPAILKVVADGLKGASAIQAQDIANRVAAIPPAEAAAASRQAVGLSAKYTNLDVAEVLQLYREVRSVLPNPAEVPDMMDPAARAKAVMTAGGLDTSGLIFALKAAELVGAAKTPEKLTAFLDAFLKAQQVEGKTITPEGLYDFAQQLKAAAPNLSASFVNTLGPLLAQEMQGGKAGTSVQQFEKQLQGGFQGQLHMAAKEFVALGLAERSDFESTKTGQIMGMKRGHQVVGADLANTDPDKWVYTVLVPALHKAGFKTTEAMIKELPRLFPNTNAANLVAKFIQQQDQWTAKEERINAGEGLGAYESQSQGAGVAFGALKTQVQDLISVFDSPAMKGIGEGLSTLAADIGVAKVKVGEFADAFPGVARGLADVATAVGLAAAGFLSLKLFTGLTGGFGLKSSAVALDVSAAELSAAAARLGVGGAAGAGVGVAAAEAGAGGMGLWAGIKFGLGRMAVPVAIGAIIAAAVKDARDAATGIPSGVLGNPDASREQVLAALLDAKKHNDGGFLASVTIANLEKQLAEIDDPDKRPAWQRLRDAIWPLKDPALTGGGWKPSPTETPPWSPFGAVALPDVKPRADEGKAALDQLNATVKPEVDLSSIDAAIAKIMQLRDGLAGLGRLGAGPVSSLGATQRGRFTFGGVSGE